MRLLLRSAKTWLCATEEILVDTDATQQPQPSNGAVDAMRSSSTQSGISGAGATRPLARQDHVRGSAESLVTKVSLSLQLLTLRSVLCAMM